MPSCSDIKRYIQADTDECARCLGEILALILAEGGRVHPGARWRESRGHMTLECERLPAAEQPTLIEIPRTLLVPVSHAEWQDDVDRLILRQPPSGLSPAQQHLLALHIELYNAAGKLPWTLSHLPRIALRDVPDIQEALRALRPRWNPAPEIPARVFMSTRVIGLRPVGKPAAGSSDETSRKTQVLMPLIDILNHHPQGSPFIGDEHGMRVRVAQPGLGLACYANYGGRRDVLDLALQHGYVDFATPFAFSAPVRVEVAGLGCIQVGQTRTRSPHRFDPPRVEWQDETLHLSHLCVDREHPERLHAALRLPLLATTKRRGLTGDLAEQRLQETLYALLDANLKLLDQLSAVVAPYRDTSPAAAILQDATERQAATLRFGLHPVSRG